MPGENYGRGWKKLRLRVLDRDAWLCSWCGIDLRQTDVTASVDHVIPIEDGGTHELDNLVASCKSCNSSRGARPGPPKRVRDRAQLLAATATAREGVSRSLPPVSRTYTDPARGQKWKMKPKGVTE